MFCPVKEDVLAPPPENDDVVNDFDIEEEVIEVENRLDAVNVIFIFIFFFKSNICERGKCPCVSEKQMFGCVFREENLAKIARRVKDYKVEEMNAPREGKRLLVLDVDYTLFGKNIKNVLMCAQDYVHRRPTSLVVVVKTTRRLASTAPSLFVSC